VVPRGRVSELARTLERQGNDSRDALWIRVGRELGARWVLTGSFQRAGDAVRVTAQLLDPATAHAERTIKIDGRMQEIFALQDRLVRDLAGLLRAVIRPTAAATLETGVVGAFERRARLGADEPFTRYYAAAAHALRGDADTAIAFLERAASARRAFTLARARIEPEFAALRNDLRMQRLLHASE
jgi:hypothetical protein